jgi:hypothetical protein
MRKRSTFARPREQTLDRQMSRSRKYSAILIVPVATTALCFRTLPVSAWTIHATERDSDALSPCRTRACLWRPAREISRASLSGSFRFLSERRRPPGLTRTSREIDLAAFCFPAFLARLCANSQTLSTTSWAVRRGPDSPGYDRTPIVTTRTLGLSQSTVHVGQQPGHGGTPGRDGYFACRSGARPRRPVRGPRDLRGNREWNWAIRGLDHPFARPKPLLVLSRWCSLGENVRSSP